MLQKPVYLDYNSTTPVDPGVMNAMMPYFTEKFGNAASNTHAYGWVAAEAVDFAREQLAKMTGAEREEIIFTSGATEAINLGLKGAAESYHTKGKHIISIQTEHKAVLDSLFYLVKKGFDCTLLPVNRDGQPDLDQLEHAIRPETILIAAMSANNETGVLLPVDTIGKIAHEKDVLFFCDATQAAGKIRLDVNEMRADLLCLSAHKIYGPKGAGALFVRRKNPKVKITPQIHGGGHENGLRSGTLNVPGIAGFGEACRLADVNRLENSATLASLRNMLEKELLKEGDILINGSRDMRLPNTSNLLIKGVKSASLIRELPGLAFSAGSACSSSNPEPSHVLRAMGLTMEEAGSSVRFSLGRFTTVEQVSHAVVILLKAVKKLRKLNEPF